MTDVKQDFSAVVGDVAGRDMVVHHNYTKGRKLSREERIELNNLVRQLREIDDVQDGRTTWKLIHGLFGVNQVEDMCIEHFQPSKTILGLMIGKAELIKSSALKVSKEEFAAIKFENDRLKGIMAKPVETPPLPLPPQTSHKNKSLGLKIALVFVTIMALAAIGMVVNLGRELKSTTAQVMQCVYDDNSYSVGGVITDTNKIQRECINVGSLTKWQRAGFDHRANK